MTTRYETDEEVGDRLRRTFARRADDMAAGDGTLWRAVGGPFGTPAPGDSVDAVDAGALAGPGRAGTDARAARRRRPVLAVAASLLVVGGVAAVAVTRQAGTGDGPDTGGPGTAAEADAPGTTAPPTPTTLAPGGTYTFGAFERGPEQWVTVSFEAGIPGAQADIPGILGPQFRPIQAGPNRGYVVEGPIVSVWLQFDDGIVRLESGGVLADELTAIAATVGKDASTGRYTVPTPEGWVDDPAFLEPLGDTPAVPPEQEADGLGRFVAPGGASYNAIWYPGWTTDNLPTGTEPVNVADGPAYVGSIVPGVGDMLQLWVVYDDGVVELQAAGMTRDDLVTAGNGVTRTPGTDDFALAPPPGYAPG